MHTEHTSTVCENKYQLSIFICEMKCNKNKNESPSSGNTCQPTLSARIMHANGYNTPDEHSVHLFFLSSQRIKALIFNCNSIQFNSQEKNEVPFRKWQKPTMKQYTQIREKICDGKADKTTIDKSIDRTTSIIIIKAKKLCFTGVKHSFPLKPCNLYRALESAHECICLNRSEYVLEQRHIVSFCESHCTHAHRHIGSTSRVPACIFHSIVSTTYLDTIYLKMVKWWCTMWCVNCDKIFVHIMTLHYLSPALPHLFSFLFCSTAPFLSLSRSLSSCLHLNGVCQFVLLSCTSF